MKNTPTSRRNFLSTLAILSAGSTFGSVANFLPITPVTDLPGKWKQFYQKFKGLPTSDVVAKDENALLPSQGHHHKTGTPVFFPDQQLFAQPTWVYWKEENKKPSDVIITFYSMSGAKEKLFRLNRFELEALIELPEDDKGKEAINLLRESAQNRSSMKAKNAPLVMKTKVYKGQQVHIHTSLFEKKFHTRKQLIINS